MLSSYNVSLKIDDIGATQENGHTYENYRVSIVKSDGQILTKNDTTYDIIPGWYIATVNADDVERAFANIRVEDIDGIKSIVFIPTKDVTEKSIYGDQDYGKAGIVLDLTEHAVMDTLSGYYYGSVNLVDADTNENIAKSITYLVQGSQTKLIWSATHNTITPSYPYYQAPTIVIGHVYNPLISNNPVLAHYTFDHSDMAINGNTYNLFNGLTANTPIGTTFTGTLYYKRIHSNVVYTFVDDDDNDSVVKTITLSGQAGDTTSTNLVIPDKYAKVADLPENVTFADTNTNVTLHIKHNVSHPVESNNATRTFVLHYPDGSTKTIEQIIGLSRTNDFDDVLAKVIKHGAWQAVANTSSFEIDGQKQKDYAIYNVKDGKIMFAPIKLPVVAGYRPVIRKNTVIPTMFMISFVAMPISQKPVVITPKSEPRSVETPLIKPASKAIPVVQIKRTDPIYQELKQVLPNYQINPIKADDLMHAFELNTIYSIWIRQNGKHYVLMLKDANGQTLKTISADSYKDVIKLLAGLLK